MARKKEFDRDQALLLAIAAFRHKGFAGTSTDDLIGAMGIGRQSMYDTFGDKRRLYLEALQRYNSDSIGAFIRDLEAGATPLAGLTDAMLAFASQAAQTAAGCMGVQAISEFGIADADVTEVTAVSSQAQGAALERTLAKARALGEVKADLDDTAGAHFIGAALAGIKVSARAGMPAAALQQIARLAIGALTP